MITLRPTVSWAEPESFLLRSFLLRIRASTAAPRAAAQRWLRTLRQLQRDALWPPLAVHARPIANALHQTFIFVVFGACAKRISNLSRGLLCSSLAIFVHPCAFRTAGISRLTSNVVAPIRGRGMCTSRPYSCARPSLCLSALRSNLSIL